MRAERKRIEGERDVERDVDAGDCMAGTCFISTLGDYEQIVRA